MALFDDINLADEDFFRAVILYGRNTASYKFALAESLISIASGGKDHASLQDLAVPFSEAICRHLETQDKQALSQSNPFLDMLRAFNRGELGIQDKIDATARLGFRYVLDAFHVVGRGDIPIRFFHSEPEAKQPRIVFTDELLKISTGSKSKDLLKENDSRWSMVEAAWAYNLPKRLIMLDYDPDLEALFAIDNSQRRQPVTSARHALNGYQRSKCFYCERKIHLEDSTMFENRGEVDHFFPHVLMRNRHIHIDLDQAWNLVLACNKCNGAAGKSALCPHTDHVEDLYKRNEYLVMSHHPLRESIIFRTGNKPSARRDFLQYCYNAAYTAFGGQAWKANRYLG